MTMSIKKKANGFIIKNEINNKLKKALLPAQKTVLSTLASIMGP